MPIQDISALPDMAGEQGGGTTTMFEELPVPSAHDLPPSENGFFCCYLDDCTKQFPSASLLRSHLRRHILPVLCPAWCGVRKAETPEMKSHLRSKHPELAELYGEDMELLKCEWCQEGFSRKSNMVKHQKKYHQTEIVE